MIEMYRNMDLKEQEQQKVETPEEEPVIAAVGLFEIKPFDVTQNFKIDVTQHFKTVENVEDLIEIAKNSEKPFAELKRSGICISEAEFAEIQQSDRLTFSASFNLNERIVEVMEINGGKGGIAEGDRNDSNISFRQVDFGEHEAEHSKEEQQSKYQIYQLPDGEQYHGIRFESREQLEKDGVQLNHEDYQLAYEGTILEFKGNSTLEQLYTEFNSNRPNDFTGRSLSVSDVVVVSGNGTETAYFCDKSGFVEMPEFFREKELTQEKTAEDSIKVYGELEKEICRGTGLFNGKFRVQDFFEKNNPTNQQLADFLKKEYGTGGHSGEGKISFVDYNSKGMTFSFENGQKHRHSWDMVATITKSLLESDTYLNAEEKSEFGNKKPEKQGFEQLGFDLFSDETEFVPPAPAGKDEVYYDISPEDFDKYKGLFHDNVDYEATFEGGGVKVTTGNLLQFNQELERAEEIVNVAKQMSETGYTAEQITAAKSLIVESVDSKDPAFPLIALDTGFKPEQIEAMIPLLEQELHNPTMREIRQMKADFLQENEQHTVETVEHIPEENVEKLTVSIEDRLETLQDIQEILENMDVIETGEYDWEQIADSYCEPDVNDPVNVVLSELQIGNMPAEELIEDAVFRLQDIQEQEQQEGHNYYSKY